MGETYCWFLPGDFTLAGEVHTLFYLAMPLPDADHSLHHVPLPSSVSFILCAAISSSPGPRDVRVRLRTEQVHGETSTKNKSSITTQFESGVRVSGDGGIA